MQLLVEKRETIDIKRLSIFTLLGFVLVAPTLHFWYFTSKFESLFEGKTLKYPLVSQYFPSTPKLCGQQRMCVEFSCKDILGKCIYVMYMVSMLLGIFP